MPCCGRPNVRTQKATSYYDKYAYHSSHVIKKQLEAKGSKCASCDALTLGDPCNVCGNPKQEVK